MDIISKKIFLVRHGQTGLNAKHICQGRTDVPINENGVKQAEISADYLLSYLKENNLQLPERIISSPLTRTKQTTAIFEKALNNSPEITYDERLIERNFGDIENISFDVITEEYKDALDVLTIGRITDDEVYKEKLKNNQDVLCSLEPRIDVQKRFLSAIKDEVKRDKSNKPLLFVSHGAAIAAISHTLMTGEYEEIISTVCMGNCHIAVFDVQCSEDEFTFYLDGYDLGDW